MSFKICTTTISLVTSYFMHPGPAIRPVPTLLSLTNCKGAFLNQERLNWEIPRKANVLLVHGSLSIYIYAFPVYKEL